MSETFVFNSIDEVKSDIIRKLSNGWALLMGDNTHFPSIEKMWYSGEKNAGFEIYLTTINRMFVPIYIVKKEYFNPDNQEKTDTLRTYVIHDRLEKGLIVEEIHSSEKFIPTMIDNLFRNMQEVVRK